MALEADAPPVFGLGCFSGSAWRNEDSRAFIQRSFLSWMLIARLHALCGNPLTLRFMIMCFSVECWTSVNLLHGTWTTDSVINSLSCYWGCKIQSSGQVWTHVNYLFTRTVQTTAHLYIHLKCLLKHRENWAAQIVSILFVVVVACVAMKEDLLNLRGTCYPSMNLRKSCLEELCSWESQHFY